MAVNQSTYEENILSGTTDAQGGYFCTLTLSGAYHLAFAIAPDKIDKFLNCNSIAPYELAMEIFVNNGGIVNK